jgi:23S rRNA (cytosine1962-C5)-methyltransferase
MTFSQNPWKHWQIEKLCATMLPKSQKQRSSAMSLAVVTLKKGEGRLLKSGGMWIFDNEVASIMGSFVNGDIVLVHDFDGYPLGRGFINTNSRIVVRLLSRDENTVIDEEFFEKRVRDAWEYRKKVTDTSSCRVIFGEADFLPGFIVDKFSDVLVVQSLALGIDRYKEMLVELLKKVLAEDGIRICGVYERSDVKVRKQEGMEPYKGFIGEEFPTLVEIVENGVKYQVDVKDGQKTGFFLDQKYNRLAIQKLCRNARVLDCFTHTGSFALNAGYAGAKEVTGVDASQLAVDQATANAALNGLSDSVKFICEDVFDLLPKLEEKGEKYDVVILDPPAFTKSRRTIDHAYNGYKKINMKAMKLLGRGGYLITCSCSRFMETDNFEKMLRESALESGVTLKQVSVTQQNHDHPILWTMEETSYLKFYIFQII